MSTTYVAQYVSILGFILKLVGFEVGTEELTTIITSAMVFGGSLWTLYKRFQQGDVSPLGKRL